MYRIEGCEIQQFSGGAWESVFRCDSPTMALDLWRLARVQNDQKRQYTASARTISRLESLPGFAWSNPL